MIHEQDAATWPKSGGAGSTGGGDWQLRRDGLRARAWSESDSSRGAFEAWVTAGTWLLRASRDDIEIVPDRVVVEAGMDKGPIRVDWQRRR